MENYCLDAQKKAQSEREPDNNFYEVPNKEKIDTIIFVITSQISISFYK